MCCILKLSSLMLLLSAHNVPTCSSTVTDLMDLKYMLEKLGQPKTHLELKKMIKQVDLNNSGTINYHEFILMMLGKSSVLRM